MCSINPSPSPTPASSMSSKIWHASQILLLYVASDHFGDPKIQGFQWGNYSYTWCSHNNQQATVETCYLQDTDWHSIARLPQPASTEHVVEAHVSPEDSPPQSHTTKISPAKVPNTLTTAAANDISLKKAFLHSFDMTGNMPRTYKICTDCNIPLVQHTQRKVPYRIIWADWEDTSRYGWPSSYHKLSPVTSLAECIPSLTYPKNQTATSESVLIPENWISHNLRVL